MEILYRRVTKWRGKQPVAVAVLAMLHTASIGTSSSTRAMRAMTRAVQATHDVISVRRVEE